MSRAMFLTVLAGCFLALPAGHAAEPDRPAATWQRIAPYFKPPAEYAEKLGCSKATLYRYEAIKRALQARGGR